MANLTTNITVGQTGHDGLHNEERAAINARVNLTDAQTKAGVLTLTDGLVVPNGGTVSVPDGSLSQADILDLTNRLATIESSLSSATSAILALQTAVAGKADAANAIAAYVPAGGAIPTGLPVNSIVALEVAGGSSGVADPVLVGYAPIAPTGATTFTVPLPSGSVAGDMLVMAHEHTPGGAAAYAILPAGATGFATSDISTTNRLEFSYKTLLSADISATSAGTFPNGSVTFTTYGGSQKPSAGALVVRNAGTPQGTITAVTTSVSTQAPPAITTTKRALVFTFIGKRVTGATFAGSTAPTNETLMGTIVSTGAAAGGETSLGAAQYPAVLAAGTITPTAWTLNAATANFHIATIAVPATA